MWWEHRDYVWYVRHGKKIFFCRTHFFSHPFPPLGGATPEKKYPTRYQKNFSFPPPAHRLPDSCSPLVAK